jgi:hypothetical protein
MSFGNAGNEDYDHQSQASSRSNGNNILKDWSEKSRFGQAIRKKILA